MIDRKELAGRHNPKLAAPDYDSPLTVGNGGFAFTADITGMQTLYDEYGIFPLCTMSQWGWSPADGLYDLDDVDMTEYKRGGRIYRYAVECKKGNEEVYNRLRHNPHRLNLARFALLWDGRTVKSGELTGIGQKLDLWTGMLLSSFEIDGFNIEARTCCAKSADVLGFKISVPAEAAARLSVRISFPGDSHRKNASDWERAEHLTLSGGDMTFGKGLTLNRDSYNVLLTGSAYDFTAAFFPADGSCSSGWDFERVRRDSAEGWETFWQSGGTVDFSRCGDPRAFELERRTVLSQYLTAAQCAGSIPPQETGLSCNSWYGKFHLEMHILHAGWFPLWGRAGLLEKSFAWYEGILENAKANAARNGYCGARWPKMVGPEGTDSPSRIATLLIWQQPHILYMLELTRRSRQVSFLARYWEIVRETADFMSSFNFKDAPPLIPAQEEHAPDDVLNPVFELSYWRYGLETAINWAEELVEKVCAHPEKNNEDCGIHPDVVNGRRARWREALANLPELPVIDGLYPAHANCPDTFERFNRDHPSMLYAYGFIPNGRADKQTMAATADRVWRCWDRNTLWGWDFALIAMTYARLSRPEQAIEALLAGTPKNSYTVSGNNFQRGREDLPLYLPGNGSLLFALPLLLETGFPKNGMWDGIEYEGMMKFPR